ncbi:hypothetical protein L227DRAFT_374270 [Lentinus tigrinus ALCF2SS1-6]|uniref:Uncharacterized protein n=1 Tax=Lentinus tigrinus ALCF2SS1-6 TaxID=1328759 RepID=A0A5C2RQZ7_9APHY|nr:hypothetical protein L227DRAFT_374270 [Lentinus tigrinus ALCF2SS1-6]
MRGLARQLTRWLRAERSRRILATSGVDWWAHPPTIHETTPTCHQTSSPGGTPCKRWGDRLRTGSSTQRTAPLITPVRTRGSCDPYAHRWQGQSSPTRSPLRWILHRTILTLETLVYLTTPRRVSTFLRLRTIPHPAPGLGQVMPPRRRRHQPKSVRAHASDPDKDDRAATQISAPH